MGAVLRQVPGVLFRRSFPETGMQITGTAGDFLAANHKAVLSTFKRNGHAQLSVVMTGLFGGGVGISVTESRAKYLNLKRDARCSLLVSKDDWWGYLVLEGQTEIIDSSNAPDTERLPALRELYQSITGEEHADWGEYDAAMVKDRRAVVIVRPEHIYGTALS